ncbi:Card1-like endonuclease domain-containing protein [Saprospira grandis]|uniref:Uncharacterized protein n=1 Tax=Saprospira grandis (strain Lewin) TaxID=984262 RepID=H6L3T3_SAPGL|nr:DUF1887 family CARF protein [Saprospira grandis]AFC22768.1 hypothetical protein SGRA_0023 [Saprospira grandis str. Lewin]
MSNTIVLLLSDHRLPNLKFFQFLTNTKKINPDSNTNYILIGTDKTYKLKYHEHVAMALKITEDKYVHWLVSPESYEKTSLSLKGYLSQIKRSTNFFLNITTGTKMMALAAKDTFEKYVVNTPSHSLETYYIPINSENIHQIYPSLIEQEFKASLSLKEYTTSYGFKINENRSPRHLSLAEANEYWKLIKDNNYSSSNIASPFPKAGDLWEHIVFHKIASNLNLSESAIALNIDIKPIHSRIKGTEDKHELDIIFIKNDRLYIIECKDLSHQEQNASKFPSKKVRDYIYKSNSINQNLGLYAKSFIVILCPFKPNKDQQKSLDKFSKISNIKIIIAQDFEGKKFTDLIR